MSTQSVRDRIALFTSSSSANGSREDLTAAAQGAQTGDGHGIARGGAANGPSGQQAEHGTIPWATGESRPVTTGAAVAGMGSVAGSGGANGTAEIGSTRQVPPPRPARRNPPSASVPTATISSSPPSSGATPAGWVAFGSGPVAAESPSPPSTESAAFAASNPIVPARPPVTAFASFHHGANIAHPTTASTTTIATSQTPPPRPSTFIPPPGARPLVPIPTSASPVSSLNHPLASASSTSNTPPPLPPRIGPSASSNTFTFSASSDTYADSATTSRSVSPVSLASNGNAATPRRAQPPPPSTRGGTVNGSLPRNAPSPAPAAATAVGTNQLIGLVKNVAISTSQASLSGRTSPTIAAKTGGGLSNIMTVDSIFPTIPQQTRSRYLSVFRALTMGANQTSSGASPPVDACATAPAQAIVDVWRRSRLPLATLADVWDAVVPEPRAIELNGMQFASGMWIIDQVLGGKSVEQVVSL